MPCCAEAISASSISAKRRPASRTEDRPGLRASGMNDQTGLFNGAPCAHGDDQGRRQEGGWRVPQLQQVMGVFVAEIFGHFAGPHQVGVDGQAVFAQCVLETGAPPEGEVHDLETVQQPDAPVPEVKQELGGAVESAAVVHIEP